MQKRGKPTEGHWWDATVEEQQPEYTGKFDCKIIDGDKAIYPAQWVPFGKDTGYGERGPGWKVLVPRGDGSGKNTVRFYSTRKIKRWLPADPPKRRKSA